MASNLGFMSNQPMNLTYDKWRKERDEFEKAAWEEEKAYKKKYDAQQEKASKPTTNSGVTGSFSVNSYSQTAQPTQGFTQYVPINAKWGKVGADSSTSSSTSTSFTSTSNTFAPTTSFGTQNTNNESSSSTKYPWETDNGWFDTKALPYTSEVQTSKHTWDNSDFDINEFFKTIDLEQIQKDSDTGRKSITASKTFSYNWKKEMLYDLKPKEYGRTYDEKFYNLMAEQGMDEDEAYEFAMFMDKLEEEVNWRIKNKDKIQQELNEEYIKYENKQAKKKAEEEREENPEQPERSKLDRVFDALSAFNYASAGFAMGIVDNDSGDDQNPFSRAWKGLKAGNPFGEGDIKNEYTYSKVLEESGWKPESMGGKIARGTVGFVGDVLLDPTTYLTLGTGAVVRGTGKAAISGTAKKTTKEVLEKAGLKGSNELLTASADDIAEAVRTSTLQLTKEKNPDVADELVTRLADKKANEAKRAVQLARGDMTEDMARSIIEGTGKELDPLQVQKDAQLLAREYNRVRGFREGQEGITLSLGNVIFGEKLFGDFAKKKLTLIEGKTLEKFSDKMGISRGYGTARKVIRNSGLSTKFSNNAKLEKLAKDNPEQLYSYLKFVSMTKGLEADKLASDKEAKAVASTLEGLSPADRKTLTDMMQDKRLLHKVSKEIRLADTKEAYRIKKDLEETRAAIQTEVDDLVTRKNNLDALAKTNEESLLQVDEELGILREEYRAKLAELDISKVQDDDYLQQYTELFAREADEIQRETYSLGEKFKQVDAEEAEISLRGQELNAGLSQQLSKLDAREDVAVKELEEGTEEALQGIQGEIKNAEDAFEQQSIAREMLGDNKVDSKIYEPYIKWHDTYKAGKAETGQPNVYEKVNLVRSLNNSLFNGEHVLPLDMMDGALSSIVELMKKGQDTDSIRKFITSSANERLFSPKYSHIYQTVASALGYTNWKKAYHDVKDRLDKKVLTGKALTKSEKVTLANLEKMNMERAYMIDKLSKMDIEEIKKYRRDFENARLEEQYSKIERLETPHETYESKKLIYSDNDWNIADSEGERDIYGDFVRKEKGTKHVQEHADNTRISDTEHDEITGMIFNQLSKRVNLQDGVNDAQSKYAMRVFDEIQPLLDNYFKKSYGYLSGPQKQTLIKMAFNNEYLRSQGKPVKLGVQDVEVKKAVLTKLDIAETERLDAIEKVIGVGSDIIYKTADNRLVSGTVDGLEIDPETGRFTLDVMDLEGNQVGKIKSADVRKVNELRKDITPDDILEESLIHDLELARHEDNIRVLNEKYEKIMVGSPEKYDQLIAGFNEQRAKLQEDYAKEVAKLEAKKTSNAKKRVELEHLENNLQKRLADLNTKQAEATVRPDMGQERKDLLSEYKQRVRGLKDQMKQYEEINLSYKEAMKEGRFEDIEKLRGQMDEIDEVLASTDSLETFIRMQYDVMDEVAVAGGKSMNDGRQIQKQINELRKSIDPNRKLIKQQDDLIAALERSMRRNKESNPTAYRQAAKRLAQNKVERAKLVQQIESAHIEIEQLESDYLNIEKGYNQRKEQIIIPREDVKRIIDLRTDITDEQKAMYEMVRGKFLDMAYKEVEIGKLKAEQVQRWEKHYLPHILTAEGKEFIKNRKPVDKHGNYITQDIGFGAVYNPFAESRTITKESVGTAEDPTIAEINDYFRAQLNGNNLFSEEIADIYLARAMKHNELMYDDKYMNNMLNVFGKEIGEEGVEEGYKAVMNIGVLKNVIFDDVKEEMALMNKAGMKITENTWEKILDQKLESLDLPKSILDTEATPLVELTENQMKLMLRFTPDNVRQVNDVIVQKANQARKLQIAKDRNKALQMYDKFLHFMKINQTTILPSFHLRNKMSNMYSNWVELGGDAVDLKLNGDAIHTVKNKGGDGTKRFVIKDSAGNVTGDMSWADAYELGKIHGVLDEGFFASDLGAGAMSEGGILKRIASPKWNPFDTANFTPYRVGSKIGAFNENVDRMVHFVSQLRKGLSPEEAAQSVNRTLFDYGDLTAFEQGVMKRIFPYYTFWRKNQVLQYRQLIEHPERLAVVAKGMNAVEGGVNEEDRIDRNKVDPFAQDWAQTIFTNENDEGVKEPVLWSPNLPFMDFNRTPSITNMGDTLNQMISQSSPALKIPFEVATNTNHFFNDELVSDYAKEEGQADQKYMEYAGSQFGAFNALYGTFTKDGVDLALHIANNLTGLKYMSYDTEAKEVRSRIQADELAEIKDIKDIADLNIKTDYVKSAMDFISKNGGKEIGEGIKNALGEVAESFGVDKDKLSEKVGDVKWAVLDATSLDKDILGKEYTTGKVKDVKDGDTVTVELSNGKETEIRVNLVDTPEVAHNDRQTSMQFGEEARAFTADKIMGKDVRLIIDGLDSYGRSIAYVIYDKDKDLASDLVGEGMGRMRYLQDEFGNRDLLDYLDKQQDAFENSRGVWSIPDYAGNPDDDDEYKR